MTWLHWGCHCPSCGSKKTYQDDREGDYYAGVPVVCLGCKEQFTDPDLYFTGLASSDDLEKAEQAAK